jgi:sugar phosphate isomerase/epimerase
MRERMEAIKRAGFDASSVWFGRTEHMVRSGQQDIIPSCVRDAGLVFEYVHGSYTNCNKLWSDSAEDREIIFSDYSADIEYCRKHRIPTLVVHISKGLNPRPPSEGGLEVIARLVKQAEDSDVRLAVENTLQPGHIDFILENLDSPQLGFCYDSSHDLLYCETAGNGHTSPGELLKRWGKRLFITHLSDNDGLSDKHWLPGKGIGDWRSFAEAFPSDTYTGFLTLEILPQRYEAVAEEEFLSEALESLRWFDGLIGEASETRETSSTGASSARL